MWAILTNGTACYILYSEKRWSMRVEDFEYVAFIHPGEEPMDYPPGLRWYCLKGDVFEVV